MATPPPPKKSKPSTPPKRSTPPPAPPKGPAPPPKVSDRPPRKVFSVVDWEGGDEGERIIIYAGSGKGKTTLASLAPSPVFFGLDDGGRKIKDRKLKHVPEIENFWDVRDALQSFKMFEPYKTVVVDTGNALQVLAQPYMFATIPHEKGGIVTNIEGYGWGKGYSHLVDTMRLILTDMDALIARGLNCVVLCQSGAILKANPGGDDFLEDGPGLYHSKGDPSKSVRNMYNEWADHVVKIDYLNVTTKGKKAVGETTRAVYVLPEVHFFAKSRYITEPVISFADVADDTFWQFIKEG